MATIAEMQARLEALLVARADNVRSVQYADGTRTDFKSDAELAAAIADLERRIAARNSRPIGPAYRTTRSFKDL